MNNADRLVLHTKPTNQLATISWDCDYEGITNAIEEFGYYRMEAFNILLECSSDLETFVREGSIYGLGYLGKICPRSPPRSETCRLPGKYRKFPKLFSRCKPLVSVRGICRP